jgi:hypothetical protein
MLGSNTNKAVHQITRVDLVTYDTLTCLLVTCDVKCGALMGLVTKTKLIRACIWGIRVKDLKHMNI